MRIHTVLLLVLMFIGAAGLQGQELTGPAQEIFDQAYEMMKQGYLPEATALYEKALKLAPNAKEIWLEYALVLRKGHHFQQSVKAGWRTIELDQRNVGAWTNQINTFYHSRCWDGAMYTIDKALKYTGDKNSAGQNYLNVGYALCGCGELAQAVKVITKACKLDPTNSKAFADLGMAEALQGKTARGKKNLLKAIDLLEGKSDKNSEINLKWASWLLNRLEANNLNPPPVTGIYVQEIPRILLKQPREGKALDLAITKDVTHCFQVGKNLFMNLRTPERWTLSINPSDEKKARLQPFVLQFTNEKPEEFMLLITPQLHTQALDDLKQLAEECGQDMLDTAVEDSLQLKELQSKSVHGYCYSLTEEALVGKEPEKGNYPLCTQAFLQSKDLQYFVTFLYYQKTEAFLAEMEKVLLGIGQVTR